jgi:hypothetical protein
MIGGLTVWTLVSRGGATPGEADRELYLASVRDAPIIGVDLHAADPRGAAARAAFEQAGLGDPPLRLLFTRGDVPIVGVVGPGREALEVWTALEAIRAETHLTPIILGDAYAVVHHADAARFTTESPEAIVRRAAAIDVSALPTDEPLPEGALSGVAPHEERYEVLLDPVMHFPIVEVALALVPTDVSAELPAWLAFGNWRGCPEPAVHVAMLAYLHDRVGAEPVAISADRVELRIATPPTSPEDRVALARLLAHWSPGALAREHATVATWADTLVPSRSWSISFSRPR